MFFPDNIISDRSSKDLSPSIWARLPLELIREIFCVLAMTSSKQARELRLVSSDINVLVLPLLFHRISIVKPDDIYHLTTVLLPKRRHHIPALKSRLHIMPRSLAGYTVESCAMVLKDRGPSLEEALAQVGPVFCSVSKLAITARNLQAHGYWLRRHPIRPKVMMVPHYGSPYVVNYRDSIFQRVTHLYTSTTITNGHRHSSVADLPFLSYLAVSTRHNLPVLSADLIAASLNRILKHCKKLKMLVLVLDLGPSEFLANVDLIAAWDLRLDDCFLDERFVLLPDFRPPRWEWDEIVHSPYGLLCPTNANANAKKDRPSTGRHHETIWNRAERWRRSTQARGTPKVSHNADLRFTYMRHSRLQTMDLSAPYNGAEWEIDLVERGDYKHPKPSDPDLKLDGVHGFQSAFG